MKKTFKIIATTGKYLIQNRQVDLISPITRQLWANEVLDILDLKLTTDGEVSKQKPLIIVCNHSSYLDIPILMSKIEGSVFISKAELLRWPIFGPASKKIETVFVQRNSKDSRSKAREEIIQQLIKNQKRIVVFPSGTTTLGEELFWNKGIFEIANHYSIQVQAARISYSHPRVAAYIDEDQFLYHLLNLSQEPPLRAQVEFHKPILIKNLMSDLEYLRLWCSKTATVSPSIFKTAT